ncbi:MAG TPA: ferritin-like domain-containing protein [Terriglobales bacterium]|nr:ferritin-like domain-containing protein [Terriglobales bacterium]
MKIASLRDLYVDQLRDLYDGENQIIKALPKMIESAESEELRSALEEHLEVTRQQAQRLETIFQGLGENAKGEKCKGMEGVLKEGSDLVKEDMPEAVKDAAIIASAQRVEHYEIAGYGTVRTYAELLGEDEAVNLLQEILDEEKEADEKLSGLAEEINVEAEEGETEGETEEVGSEDTEKPRRATRSTPKKGKRVA